MTLRMAQPTYAARRSFRRVFPGGGRGGRRGTREVVDEEHAENVVDHEQARVPGVEPEREAPREEDEPDDRRDHAVPVGSVPGGRGNDVKKTPETHCMFQKTDSMW